MEKLSGYCAVVVNMEKDNVHVLYHNKEYGFPIDDDNHLFARLILEINQAGLSWTTILNKKDNFFKAFDNFNIDKVARYGDKQRERLLADAGIIRNRLKVDATIENAKKIKELQKEFGSFKNWLDQQHPPTLVHHRRAQRGALGRRSGVCAGAGGAFFFSLSPLKYLRHSGARAKRANPEPIRRSGGDFL